MKFLGFVLGGAVIGYLLGTQFGNSKAEEAGIFAIFVVDMLKNHYSEVGATIGGCIGGFVGFWFSAADLESNGKD